MVLSLLIYELSILGFGAWNNGSILIPTMSRKFKSKVLVITCGYQRAIQDKPFILAYNFFLPLYVFTIAYLVNFI